MKYAHHPSGRAHFSQSGRVKNTVGKVSIPFSQMSGHIFSVSFQGIERYKTAVLYSKPKRGRGLVVFPFDGAGAYKFVAHIHSEPELARMVTGTGTTLWLNCVAPSGRLVRGITFQTKFWDMRGPRYLLLYVEPEQEICGQHEDFLLFLGGFDPPEISLDRSKETRALMFLYPEKDCTPELLQRVGTIDLA
ncbi:MAG TPA: hypothetical protein VK581_05790 [Chthoniobacterales bacterium]|nr:hypothetical protein [Chthoniobacterales bacterium]